jgi:predicted RND superfamily exporter protein
MDLEQVRPNKPNFALIGVLSCVAIVVIFLAVLLVLHIESRHMTQKQPPSNPNAMLRLSSASVRA